ncbi:MAG: DUF2341 domain-containing protein, partial [Nitrospiraceae bacterium]|nr:DUF2341 domain-containing protein [Nitrospiraceae bacterium]
MYSLDYSNDNIYTGNISNKSDIKYINTFNFNYNFNTDKSIISDYTNSTASVCFYKNKGTTIFSSGRYNQGIINFSDKTFYKCYDLDHNLNNILGFKSSSSFFGSVSVLINIDEDWGLKINFYDVYNVVNSLWIYVKNNILYVKTNTDILYSRTFVNLTFGFSIYDKKIVVDSKNILSTIISAFLPYNFFIYGGVNDIQIVAKSFMPMTFEGTGKVIDDIYGDAYCITGEIESFGYLRSTANNVLTSSEVFAFDIACRSVGQSIPFSISNNVSFDSSGFIMNDSCVWVYIDTTISGFTGNILTTSGIVTVSGVLSSVNDYYFIRCYYDGNKFGVMVNGEDAHINCSNTVLSGSNLNILTNNFLSIDSFAFYDGTLPSLELYNTCLTKLNSAVSSTALVNSNNKILFAADNFYTNSASYTGLFYNNWKIPLTYTTNTFYTNYSIAGGEVLLNNDNFYANKSLFNESVYNCFICENDKSFLTYFSGIIVPANRILAESFTNYDYVSENFITTNSGLYIRNCSKVFDRIGNTVSIIEFSNIGWSDYLGIGILFGIDSIPEYSNENCVIIVGNGISYVGTTSFSNLDATSNNSIYFYINNSHITVSGSNTGVLCSGIVTANYEYIHYFVKSTIEGFSYRSLITLDEPTPLDNYQLKIDLTSSVFDYSKAKPNGEDLKFYYTGEGAEELDYWIENWDILGTSTVWVKITVSGTSEFYMYYDNPGAFSTSNGDNVFEFFDDFEGTSLDTNKWEVDLTQGGDYSILDSQINIWATTAWRDVYITTKASKKIELPITVSAKVKSSNGSCGELFVGLYNGVIDKTYSITRDTTCN